MSEAPAGFYYLLSRPEMLEYMPAGVKRVLDVGCGEGNFGALVAEQRGAEVWGAEIEPRAACVAEGKLYRVLTGDMTRQGNDLPHGYFDCICCNDVLEHMADPEATLTLFHRLLVPNGVVVASIPNLRYYRALKHIVLDRDFCYTDWGVFDRTHLRFFTKRSIVRMFERSGYEVLEIEGINSEITGRWLWRKAISCLQALGGRFLDDTKYMQFACVARTRTRDAAP